MRAAIAGIGGARVRFVARFVFRVSHGFQGVGEIGVDGKVIYLKNLIRSAGVEAHDPNISSPAARTNDCKPTPSI